jgi:type I restriction enzyme R subunit
MDAVIQDQYQALEEPEQDPFKSQLSSFCKLYLFLAQIIPYQDCDLEKLYAYGRCLLKKLPHPDQDTIVDISNLIELKCYRLEEVSRGSIDLNTGEAQPLRGPTDVGTRQADQEKRPSPI